MRDGLAAIVLLAFAAAMAAVVVLYPNTCAPNDPRGPTIGERLIIAGCR